MAKRITCKKPARPKIERSGKVRVAGEELVAGITPVRVGDGVGLDVPAVVVPVRVHGPEHLCAALSMPPPIEYRPQVQTRIRFASQGCIVFRASKLDSEAHRFYSFFGNIRRHARARHAARNSRPRTSEALRASRSRRTRAFLTHHYIKNPPTSCLSGKKSEGQRYKFKANKNQRERNSRPASHLNGKETESASTPQPSPRQYAYTAQST